MTLQAVSFQRISQVFDVTDALGLNRKEIEIPLSPENPDLVRHVSGGKLEIIVDAAQPFDRWLAVPQLKIRQVRGS